MTGPGGSPLPPIVDFDVLFIPESYEKVVLIAPQLAFHEATGMRLAGTSGWYHPDLLELGRRHVGGARFSSLFFPESPLPNVQQFAHRYQEVFSSEPDAFAAQGYDAAQLVLVQLARGSRSRTAVRDGVLGVRGFPGASGVLSMRQDGNARKRPFLLRRRERPAGAGRTSAAFIPQARFRLRRKRSHGRKFLGASPSPKSCPVLPLREMVVFPYMVMPLFVKRDRSIAAVEDALAGDRLLMLVAQRDPEIVDPTPDDLYRVGTVVTVMRTLRMADGRMKVLVQGLARASIDAFVENPRALWGAASPLPSDEEAEWCVEGEALVRTVRARVEELLPLKNLPPEVLSVTANVNEPGRLADLVAANLRLRAGRGAGAARDRRPAGAAAPGRRAAAPRGRRHRGAGRDPVPGAGRDDARPARALPARAAARDPGRARRGRSPPRRGGGVPRQGRRGGDARGGARRGACASCAASSACTRTGPRRTCVRTYLDWMVELPWSKASPDRIDLANARAILDEDHAHLNTIKDRILEFLGVRKLRARLARADPVLRRPAGRRQDLARPLDRARDGPRVRAHLAGRRARRGGDPRPPAHLRRRAARPHPPGPPAGRHQQPGLHARRDRQARRGLPRRSVLGAARGARPRAELPLQRSLSQRRASTSRRSSSSPPRTCSTRSPARCATASR